MLKVFVRRFQAPIDLTLDLQHSEAQFDARMLRRCTASLGHLPALVTSADVGKVRWRRRQKVRVLVRNVQAAAKEFGPYVTAVPGDVTSRPEVQRVPSPPFSSALPAMLMYRPACSARLSLEAALYVGEHCRTYSETASRASKLVTERESMHGHTGYAIVVSQSSHQDRLAT